MTDKGIEEKIKEKLETDGWHIGDGIDDCSGYDHEAMEVSVQALTKLVEDELEDFTRWLGLRQEFMTLEHCQSFLNEYLSTLSPEQEGKECTLGPDCKCEDCKKETEFNNTGGADRW